MLDLSPKKISLVAQVNKNSRQKEQDGNMKALCARKWDGLLRVSD